MTLEKQILVVLQRIYPDALSESVLRDELQIRLRKRPGLEAMGDALSHLGLDDLRALLRHGMTRNAGRNGGGSGA